MSLKNGISVLKGGGTDGEGEEGGGEEGEICPMCESIGQKSENAIFTPATHPQLLLAVYPALFPMARATLLLSLFIDSLDDLHYAVDYF